MCNGIVVSADENDVYFAYFRGFWFTHVSIFSRVHHSPDAIEFVRSEYHDWGIILYKLL